MFNKFDQLTPFCLAGLDVCFFVVAEKIIITEFDLSRVHSHF